MEQLVGVHHHHHPSLSPRTPTHPHPHLHHLPSNRFRDHHHPHPHPHAAPKILRITPPLFLILLVAVYLLASVTILSAPAPLLRSPKKPKKLLLPIPAQSSSSSPPSPPSPELFELDNGRIQARISNVGATVVSLLVPDKNGVLGDVVLGFDSLDPYLQYCYLHGTFEHRFCGHLKSAMSRRTSLSFIQR